LAIKSVITPDLGGASEVTVIEVLVKPGDTVTKETSVVTLESDKATMEIPAANAGVIKDLKVKVGDSVNTGNPLMTLETNEAETNEAEIKAT
jgi:pyruvate/2-oxoglutarate dehydrogenase complex dihydrolipoamide acyltransferase (E2) component